MSMVIRAGGGFVIAALFLAGCASVPTDAGFSDVAGAVDDQLAQRVHWRRGGPEDAEVDAAIRELLAKELSADAAVQVALLNNPTLQATYEELGVAQADLVQAGLLKNPTFLASFRFPDKTGPIEPDRRRFSERDEDPPDRWGSGTNTELELAFNFLDFLMMPLRKKVEAARFERAKLRVTNEVLAFATEVRSAYYTLIGEQQSLSAVREASGVAETAAEFAARQYDAGNLNRLEQSKYQAFYAESALAVARAESRVAAGRERLNRLMSAWGEETNWTAPAQLPDAPVVEAEFTDIEAMAVARRLDLAVAKAEAQAIAHALEIARRFRYTGMVEVGVSTERETEGQYVTGPNVHIELPIFDQGQARVARIEAEFRQSERRVEALAVTVRSEAREARRNLETARTEVDFYRTALLPLRQSIVSDTQLFVNGMLLGVYDLLDAKRDEVLAMHDSIHALRDYWIARTELVRVIGGRPNPGDGTTPPTPATKDSTGEVNAADKGETR